MIQLIHRSLVAIIASIALIVGLVLGGGQWHAPSGNLPDAGRIVSWTQQFLLLANTLFGIRILGVLVTIGFLEPQSKDTVSPEGRAQLIKVSRLCIIWSGVSFLLAIVTLAVVLGLSISDTFSPGTLSNYLWALPPSRSFLYTSLLAVSASIVALITASLNSVALQIALVIGAIVAPLLNSHSASVGDHSLGIASSVIHGVSMSLWTGAFWSVLKYVRNGDAKIIQRYSALATWSVAALVVSGIAATYSRLDSVSDLWTSGFGQLVVLKVFVFGIASYFAIKARRAIAQSQSAAKFGAFEITFLSIAIGLGVALHSTPLSRLAATLPSAAEETLGFAFPPAPTFRTVVFGWHPEWLILTGALVAAALYTLGVSRVRRNNIAWSPLRTISFMSGIGLIIWATCAGIAKYSMVSFASHMVAHMTLSMLAPILIVLGMPVTLALRALPAQHDDTHRNPRSWILSLLQSRYSSFVSHPLFVLAVFTFGLYGMYFTPLFGTLMASHVGHLFMEVHFLLSGTLFAFVVIGLDPSPRNVPHLVRLMLVLVAISLHAFFAIALMQSATPIGNEWYSIVRPPWIENPLDDTYAGGGVAWAIGEIPSLLLMVIVAVQWARSEERVATRSDRQADRDGDQELNAYNERLARMNQADS